MSFQTLPSTAVFRHSRSPELIRYTNQVEGNSRDVTAAQTYQIECHTSSMIRAAEDLLALTRSLKEAWLFGQLGSELGVVDPATDANAKEVGEMLRKLASKPSSSS